MNKQISKPCGYLCGLLHAEQQPSPLQSRVGDGFEGFAGTPTPLWRTARHKARGYELELSKGKGYGSRREDDGPVLSALGDR